VLPWYQDTGRTVAYEIAKQTEDIQKMRLSHVGVSVCVAGDLNVNLDGPHYYGKDESKVAVRTCLADLGLVTLTDFAHTGQVQFGEFGLIDHIAVSELFVERAGAPDVWQRENERGQTMSDHCGVAIEFSDVRELTTPTGSA
jgi:endonuclease/exonuclease/phosphatase family metal-dependent hydrolase